MNNYMNVMHATSCNCASCTPVPNLSIKMPYEEKKNKTTTAQKGRKKLIVGENDLATATENATKKAA